MHKGCFNGKPLIIFWACFINFFHFHSCKIKWIKTKKVRSKVFWDQNQKIIKIFDPKNQDQKICRIKTKRSKIFRDQNHKIMSLWAQAHSYLKFQIKRSNNFKNADHQIIFFLHSRSKDQPFSRSRSRDQIFFPRPD